MDLRAALGEAPDFSEKWEGDPQALDLLEDAVELELPGVQEAAEADDLARLERLFRGFHPELDELLDDGEDLAVLAALVADEVWLTRAVPALSTCGAPHPAIPSLLVEDIARLLAGPIAIDDGDVLHGRPKRQQRIGSLIRPAHAPEVQVEEAKLARAFPCLNAHRWLRSHVALAWTRRLLGQPDECLRVAGGYGTLLAGVGGSGSKAATQLKRVLHLLRHLKPESVPTDDTLLSLNEFGRTVEVTLGAPLAHGYVHRLKKLRFSGKRALTPLPSRLPSLDEVNPKRAAAACSFEMLLIDHVRQSAAELVEDGSVYIAKETLSELGRKVGLPMSEAIVLPLIWNEEPDPVLRHLGDQWFTIGETHLLLREFLEEGGQMTIAGRARQRKAKR